MRNNATYESSRMSPSSCVGVDIETGGKETRLENRIEQFKKIQAHSILQGKIFELSALNNLDNNYLQKWQGSNYPRSHKEQSTGNQRLKTFCIQIKYQNVADLTQN